LLLVFYGLSCKSFVIFNQQGRSNTWFKVRIVLFLVSTFEDRWSFCAVMMPLCPVADLRSAVVVSVGC